MIEQVFEYNQHFVAMMNVINAAKLNKPSQGHFHHIIPQCYYKMNNMQVDNSENNLVLLSPEDHLKVHKLAVLCAKSSELKSKMGYAVHILGGTMTGLHHSEHTKELLRHTSKGNKNRLGKKLNDEQRKRLSEAHKGQIPWNTGIKMSDESKAKMSAAKLGTHQSDVTKAKLSASLKGRISPMKDRTQSEEAKNLISKSSKGRKMPFKGKTWKLINGKRVWINKEEV